MEMQGFSRPLSGGLLVFLLLLTSVAEGGEAPSQGPEPKMTAPLLVQATQSEQKPASNQPDPPKTGKAGKPSKPEEQPFLSPEGKPLPSPEEVLKRKPETKTEGYFGSTFGESLLKLGTEEKFIDVERRRMKAEILSFIPPLLQSAIAGDAYILPPNTFRASVDYGFTNLTGRNDVVGNTGLGQFQGGFRMQSTTLTLLYGFDLNRKFLHRFTVGLSLPYVGAQSRGFAQPAGPAGPQVNTDGSVAALGDVSLMLKKQVVDQANFPVGLAVFGRVFLPTGSNHEKFGNNGVVGCSPTCPGTAQQTFTLQRFTDDGRLPAMMQPGTGAWGYQLGGFMTRQLSPGDISFLAGTPFDRGAIHVGGLHRWNFESNGIDPGGQSTAFISAVAPMYKDFLSLEVTNLWMVQQADHYRGQDQGMPRGSFTEGSTGLLGPSLIYSPDPQIRFRATSLFRVKEPELGPSPPFLVNFGLDVTF